MAGRGKLVENHKTLLGLDIAADVILVHHFRKCLECKHIVAEDDDLRDVLSFSCVNTGEAVSHTSTKHEPQKISLSDFKTRLQFQTNINNS